MPSLLDMFGAGFEDPISYAAQRPDAAYMGKLLAKDDVFVIAAIINNQVVGGLVTYDLQKIEQQCSEIYIGADKLRAADRCRAQEMLGLSLHFLCLSPVLPASVSSSS